MGLDVLSNSGVSIAQLFGATLPSAPVGKEEEGRRQIELSFGSYEIMSWPDRGLPILLVPAPNPQRAFNSTASSEDLALIAQALGNDFKPSKLTIANSGKVNSALIEREIRLGANDKFTITMVSQRGQDTPQKICTFHLVAEINGCKFDYNAYHGSGGVVTSGKLEINKSRLSHDSTAFRSKDPSYFILNNGCTPSSVLDNLLGLSASPDALSNSSSPAGLLADIGLPRALVNKVFTS